MKKLASVYWVIFIPFIIISSACDREEFNERVTIYAGLYTDTLTVKVGSRYIVDTVITKSLIRINDSTYKMCYAFGIVPGNPFYSSSDTTVIHIGSDNKVSAEVVGHPPSIPLTLGYIIPQQFYFYIICYSSTGTLTPTIDKMRRL